MEGRILCVVYDINDDNRRDIVANYLLRFGRRIQKSVYLLHLMDNELNGFINHLKKLIGEENSLGVFFLCEKCLSKSFLLSPEMVSTERSLELY